MILLLAVYILCLCPASQSLDYCVVVPDTGDCALLPNNAQCNTLQYYANNSNFTSNSIFHFLEGEHTLSTVVEVTNVANLSLVGVGLHQNLSKVQCTGQPYAGFVVRNFANFSVANLSFLDCNNGPHMTWRYVNSTFYLEAGSGLIFHSVISKSFGIVAHIFQGRYVITNSIFLDTDVTWIWYFNCTGSSHLSINNSKFLHGRNGLILSIGCSHVHVTITNSVFSFNQDYNIAIYLAIFLGNY